MVELGDVLLDVGCSSQVRAAVQAVFPGSSLRVQDIESMTKMDRVGLNQACVVVFRLRDYEGAIVTPVIDQLRAIAPHVGVIVVEERSAALDPWLRRLALSGVDDAFALDRPGDEKVLREVLANRVALPPPEVALRKLCSLWVDCAVRVEAIYCVRNGYRPRHRFLPHRWFGLTEQSMRAKFERAAVPTPLFLTRFGRELHWNESVARHKLSRTRVAMLLGFETLSQMGVERRRIRKAAARWPALSALLS